MVQNASGIHNMLAFADLEIAVQRLLPVIFNGDFLNFLFYLRLLGIVLTIIFLGVMLILYIKIKTIKKPKKQKVGLSSLDQDSLLNDRNAKVLYKKIDDYLLFNNILYWKLALAEIDSYMGKVLTEIGFTGMDIYEKICNANNYVDFNMEFVKDASAKVAEILNDSNYLLTREETDKLIVAYKEALEELKKL